VFYKKVTLGQANVSLIQTVSAYISAGFGEMQAALYSDSSGTPANLLEVSYIAHVYGPGWQSVAFTPVAYTPGTYWLAVEATNSAKVLYSTAYGGDLFQYTPFNTWPSPADPQTTLGTVSLYTEACGY
jgi:hypothetical protein